MSTEDTKKKDTDTPETDEQAFTFATAKVNLPPPGLKLVRAGFAQQLERERDKARAVARFWQEQYAHAHPEHDWQDLPWESK